MPSASLSIPRIVLDTNVCLDLWAFADPGCAAVQAALDCGAVQAVTRADCRAEWQRVLHYPRLPIDDQSRPGIAAAFTAQVQLLGDADSVPDAAARLPRCADPDDQKFLELALASGARWLLSKDHELLKLDRRARAAGGFSILLPQAWTLALASGSAGVEHDAAVNRAKVAV
jgi:putative PIN family toxin of toxin-antitoxin system